MNDLTRYSADSTKQVQSCLLAGKVFIVGSIYIMNSDDIRSAIEGVSKDSLCKGRDSGVTQFLHQPWKRTRDFLS